jgi:hypothetical protein
MQFNDLTRFGECASCMHWLVPLELYCCVCVWSISCVCGGHIYAWCRGLLLRHLLHRGVSRVLHEQHGCCDSGWQPCRCHLCWCRLCAAARLYRLSHERLWQGVPLHATPMSSPSAVRVLHGLPNLVSFADSAPINYIYYHHQSYRPWR